MRPRTWRPSSLLEVCRPGLPGTALLDVYEAAGVSAPPVPVARGLGLGFDLPIVAADLPATAAEDHFEPGQIFALTSFVWEAGAGAVIAVDPVHVTEDGAELLRSEVAQ